MTTDARSSLAANIMSANPRAYEALVVTGGTPTLAHDLLAKVEPAQLLNGLAATPAAASAMLAGLWLWHDGLEECHRIVQQTPSGKSRLQDMTATFACWHAILHRREGDFSNSKYWFARCPDHASFPPLAAEVNSLLGGEPADKSFLRMTHNGWNPSAFVDLVEAVESDPADPRRSAVIRVQQAEWRQLFQYCLRAAMQ